MTTTKKAAIELAKYLNSAQEITSDYHVTLSLAETSDEVLNLNDESLRQIASVIYICKDVLKFVDHVITYNGNAFTVELNCSQVPF